LVFKGSSSLSHPAGRQRTDKTVHHSNRTPSIGHIFRLKLEAIIDQIKVYMLFFNVSKYGHILSRNLKQNYSSDISNEGFC